MTMYSNQTTKPYAAVPADWANLPMVLTVEEICAILGIGESKAYRLMAEPGFPRIRIGRTYKVYRDGLKKYLEASIERNGLNA